MNWTIEQEAKRIFHDPVKTVKHSMVSRPEKIIASLIISHLGSLERQKQINKAWADWAIQASGSIRYPPKVCYGCIGPNIEQNQCDNCHQYITCGREYCLIQASIQCEQCQKLGCFKCMKQCNICHAHVCCMRNESCATTCPRCMTFWCKRGRNDHAIKCITCGHDGCPTCGAHFCEPPMVENKPKK